MAPPVGFPHHEALVTQDDASARRPPPPDPAAEPALRVTGVTVGYPGQPPLLAQVDLQAVPGEVVGLVGVSGTGKTSLLKTIAGILEAQQGTVEVLGRTSPHRPPRGSVGYIPQRLGLVAHASVLDNVLMGALHREPTWRNALRLPSSQILEETRAVLERVGLAEKEEDPVNRLSGGQQRRVAVARALLQRPRILLADEFLSELDRATAQIVEEAVLELAARHDTAIVLVEHHVQKARHMAHRVYEVRAGFLQPLPEPPQERRRAHAGTLTPQVAGVA